MSAESMMQDGSKHVYHSIPMDVPGAVAMTDRSRCCGGTRKAMTLILASALLWVIVLDIMLVVYKSHHLGNSANRERLDSQLAGSVMILAGPLRAPASPGDNRNNSHLSTPPPGNATDAAASHGDGSAGESGEERARAGESGEMPWQRAELARRNAGVVMPGLQDWLSRLRHRPPLMMTSPDHHGDGEPPLLLRRMRPHPAGHRLWPSGPLHTDNALSRPETAAAADKPLHGSGPFGPGPSGPGPRGAETGSGDAQPAAPSESAFLVRFFSAIVDAPWNLTSPAGSGRRRRPLLPVPGPTLSRLQPPPPPPPPPPSPPPPRPAFGPPFLPGRFMNLISPPNLNSSDDEDSDEAIFDIDITD